MRTDSPSRTVVVHTFSIHTRDHRVVTGGVNVWLSCNVRPNAPPYLKSHYMIFATKSTNVTPATIARESCPRLYTTRKFYVYVKYSSACAQSRGLIRKNECRPRWISLGLAPRGVLYQNRSSLARSALSRFIAKIDSISRAARLEKIYPLARSSLAHRAL